MFDKTIKRHARYNWNAKTRLNLKPKVKVSSS